MTLTGADSAPPTLRERKKAQTRAALHEAAARLAAGPGLAGVTVEEICAAAQVSPRTFFNYYPSKAAAVIGLPDTRISEDARRAFLDGGGNVVRDLCTLVATVLDGERRPDKAAVHELLQRHPELQGELHSWLAGTRRGFAELIAERTDPDRARAALSLVMAAVSDASQSEQVIRPTGDELWDRVRLMADLVAEDPSRR